MTGGTGPAPARGDRGLAGVGARVEPPLDERPRRGGVPSRRLEAVRSGGSGLSLTIIAFLSGLWLVLYGLVEIAVAIQLKGLSGGGSGPKLLG